MNKPYSEACDQNRAAIQEVLDLYVENRSSVLEIGSGTGQHAVYFAAAYPWLSWQTSDLGENHAGIQAWIDDSRLDNVLPPLLLDTRGNWPATRYDIVFSANTAHIMSAREVEHMFINLPQCLHRDSLFLLYGPFNYDGRYTSESNQRFDQWLRQRDRESGIKDFAWLRDIAAQSGLECRADHPMPANNRILVWGRP